MNFSGISNRSIVGKLLRAPLQFIPSTLQIPILQGQLRGKRWIVGSSQHGCWLGSYEYDKQRLLQQIITPGSTLFDLGAHVGFHTLLAAELVGSSGKVIAFEPMPNNLVYLREHLRLNRITNVTVIAAAVSDHTGTATFELNNSSFKGHLSTQGTLPVKTVSLDDLIAKGEIPIPDCLKIDVEGAEMSVFRGAIHLLKEAHPTLILATHGDEIQKQCREFLTSLGYQIQPIGEKSLENADELLVRYPG
ncbi:FkbM family methyltransferase [Kovacikia minuta CCNUW1]|uniref:FkbM family methyltransferase n=1 Tax=Kovacikia minuta TaxID=2931930 RepID=UPI001CCFF9A9|nr:FkbM family methyltransferase [Kovacikia minuta]UBF28987.1 FkbM family methyltransferase [Kovacikia minuta CCNUW1]